jgi:hypothetical protein
MPDPVRLVKRVLYQSIFKVVTVPMRNLRVGQDNSRTSHVSHQNELQLRLRPLGAAALYSRHSKDFSLRFLGRASMCKTKIFGFFDQSKSIIRFCKDNRSERVEEMISQLRGRSMRGRNGPSKIQGLFGEDWISD